DVARATKESLLPEAHLRGEGEHDAHHRQRDQQLVQRPAASHILWPHSRLARTTTLDWRPRGSANATLSTMLLCDPCTATGHVSTNPALSATPAAGASHARARSSSTR